MVTRTVLCVTSAEAAAFASRGSIIQQASEITHSTNSIENENVGGKKRDLPLPSVGDPLSRGNNNENRGRNNKRSLPSEDVISGKEIKKRHKKADRFVLDLSDVPPQQPIPKCEHHVKEGSSRYTGVCFNKSANKWQAQITIDDKLRYIGYYENEEEAAIDYARSLFKYKGQDALDKAREHKKSAPAMNIDLSDVPPQQPIPKRGIIKEGASRYAGVTKSKNKWRAKIMIEGKERSIGSYENEEEAAIDYARAVFKYKGQEALDKAKERSEQCHLSL